MVCRLIFELESENVYVLLNSGLSILWKLCMLSLLNCESLFTYLG